MPPLIPHPEDVALSLTLAVVAASPWPLLLLDGDCAVVAASTSFHEDFGIPAAGIAGQSLFTLGGGRWDVPDLRRLLAIALPDDARSEVCDLKIDLDGASARHLVVHATPIDYLDLDQTRILVALCDVTDARADAARRDAEASRNITLLHEVRHRVANSLQIVASVLLQNARKTGSEETRSHLKDAHHRVMSVAALERLLSASDEGDVDVRAYFTALCESISASMIGEARDVTLAVEGGDGVVEARVAVSLGLIVTELVINALKHAFPDGRTGKIVVDYIFRGPNWILCVSDDGVGMPMVQPGRKGLGTSIVRALAGQLNAVMNTSPENPGTRISIEHTHIGLLHELQEPGSKLFSNTQPQPKAVLRQFRKDRS